MDSEEASAAVVVVEASVAEALAASVVEVLEAVELRGAGSCQLIVWSEELGVWSDECGMRNDECGMMNYECRMRNAE